LRDLDFDADAATLEEKSGAASDGRNRVLIAAAVALQFAVMMSMVVRNALPTFGSPTVLLRVVPVDPRDLMRGDYVILGYEISSMPTNTGPGATVYTVLQPEPDGRHYRGVSVVTEPPTSGRFIRGTCVTPYRIRYGIESYFVQEGKGKVYEDAVRRRKLSAVVALAADGTPALRSLLVE